jgi:CHAD domain-containing protein
VRTLEHEFKFVAREPIDPARVRAALGSRVQAAGPVRTFVQVDCYLESPDLALLRAGEALRRREVRGRVRYEWKARGRGQGAVRVRPEVGAPGPRRPPRVAAGLPPALRDLVEPRTLTAPLRTICRLRTCRRTLRLRHSGGATAELAIDEVRLLRPGRAPQRFFELELEHGPGETALWAPWIRDLARRLGLVPAADSKLERAASLLGLRPRCVQAPAHTLAGHALQQIEGLLDRAAAHEVGCRRAGDPDSVHDLRVALRRLRSLIRTYRPAFPKGALRGLRRHLAGTARALGPVRDLDVFLHDLDRLPPGGPGRDQARLRASLRAARSQALERALDHIRDPGRLRALRAWRERLQRMPPPTKRGRRDLPAAARRLVVDLARRAARQGQGLGPDPAPSRLHRLRIVLKHLRYALESLEPWLGPGLPGLRRRLVRWQDLLGIVQDAEVQGARLDLGPAPRAGKAGSKTARVRVRVREGLERRAAGARRRFLRAWKQSGGRALTDAVAELRWAPGPLAPGLHRTRRP